VRPLSTENDASCTALTTPSGVWNDTDRLRTSSRGIRSLSAGQSTSCRLSKVSLRRAQSAVRAPRTFDTACRSSSRFVTWPPYSSTPLCRAVLTAWQPRQAPSLRPMRVPVGWLQRGSQSPRVSHRLVRSGPLVPSEIW
jgi:hypothetical protein